MDLNIFSSLSKILKTVMSLVKVRDDKRKGGGGLTLMYHLCQRVRGFYIDNDRRGGAFIKELLDKTSTLSSKEDLLTLFKHRLLLDAARKHK
jgi:hypothetical protein